MELPTFPGPIPLPTRTTEEVANNDIVARIKHKTIVYIKYGHVSSYWSSPAVGTRRPCRAAWRVSVVLSVVAIPVTLLPLQPGSDRTATVKVLHYILACTSPE